MTTLSFFNQALFIYFLFFNLSSSLPNDQDSEGEQQTITLVKESTALAFLKGRSFAVIAVILLGVTLLNALFMNTYNKRTCKICVKGCLQTDSADILGVTWYLLFGVFLFAFRLIWAYSIWWSEYAHMILIRTHKTKTRDVSLLLLASQGDILLVIGILVTLLLTFEFIFELVCLYFYFKYSDIIIQQHALRQWPYTPSNNKCCFAVTTIASCDLQLSLRLLCSRWLCGTLRCGLSTADNSRVFFLRNASNLKIAIDVFLGMLCVMYAVFCSHRLPGLHLFLGALSACTAGRIILRIYTLATDPYSYSTLTIQMKLLDTGDSLSPHERGRVEEKSGNHREITTRLFAHTLGFSPRRLKRIRISYFQVDPSEISFQVCQADLHSRHGKEPAYAPLSLFSAEDYSSGSKSLDSELSSDLSRVLVAKHRDVVLFFEEYFLLKKPPNDRFTLVVQEEDAARQPLALLPSGQDEKEMAEDTIYRFRMVLHKLKTSSPSMKSTECLHCVQELLSAAKSLEAEDDRQWVMHNLTHDEGALYETILAVYSWHNTADIVRQLVSLVLCVLGMVQDGKQKRAPSLQNVADVVGEVLTTSLREDPSLPSTLHLECLQVLSLALEARSAEAKQTTRVMVATAKRHCEVQSAEHSAILDLVVQSVLQSDPRRVHVSVLDVLLRQIALSSHPSRSVVNSWMCQLVEFVLQVVAAAEGNEIMQISLLCTQNNSSNLKSLFKLLQSDRFSGAVKSRVLDVLNQLSRFMSTELVLSGGADAVGVMIKRSSSFDSQMKQTHSRELNEKGFQLLNTLILRSIDPE